MISKKKIYVCEKMKINYNNSDGLSNDTVKILYELYIIIDV